VLHAVSRAGAGGLCRCFTGCPLRDIPEVAILGKETPRSETRRCKEHKILDGFGPQGA
jgi:hypothetical protein